MCDLKGRVLIIDDDKNNSIAIRMMLKSKFNNLVVDTAVSYNSGLKKILGSDYDLVLVDYHLDGGHDAYDLIEENIRKSPIVIMTADVSKLPNGYDVWYKPLELQALLSNVEEVLNISSVFTQMQETNSQLRGFFND